MPTEGISVSLGRGGCQELPNNHLIKEQLEQENMNVYVNKNKNYKILKNHVDDIEQLDKLLLLSENLMEAFAAKMEKREAKF